ncbi:endonuclease domain-containing protein [Sphingomonas sp. 1P08PE]
MSLPEVLLWRRLRGKATGLKVRRQHPIGVYVADFFCQDAGLVIEVDGEIHGRDGRPERDAARDRFMNDYGLEVLRVRASDVLRDVDAVTTMIVARAARPLHHSPAASGPPPRHGEDFQ